MNIGEKAFKKMYPQKSNRNITVEYSRRFKPYNANITYNSRKIQFRLSHHWEVIDESIQIGLAQHLLRKAFKGVDKKTMNIELYEKFMENLPRYIFKNSGRNEPDLMASFDRVNEKYFSGFMDLPALEWGKDSTTQLGTYTYSTDTVRISRIFKGLDRENRFLLDYLMYHELLHKKFGVKHGEKGGCRHHTKEFRKLESKFVVKDAEERLTRFVRKARSLKRKKKPKLLRWRRK